MIWWCLQSCSELPKLASQKIIIRELMTNWLSDVSIYSGLALAFLDIFVNKSRASTVIIIKKKAYFSLHVQRLLSWLIQISVLKSCWGNRLSGGGPRAPKSTAAAFLNLKRGLSSSPPPQRQWPSQASYGFGLPSCRLRNTPLQPQATF